jgi:hypothetical protein
LSWPPLPHGRLRLRSIVQPFAQYLKPGLPIELVSARRTDRIAWIAYEEGKRNVFTATSPAFRPVRVTSFLKDDGIDLTNLRMSDDGSVVVFVRGSAPNADGWVANPAGDPNGSERAIWAARVAAPGSAWRLAEGTSPEVSPDGRFVVYVKDGQIYRAPRERARRPSRKWTRARRRSSTRGDGTADRAFHRTERRSRSRRTAPITASLGCTSSRRTK